MNTNLTIKKSDILKVCQCSTHVPNRLKQTHFDLNNKPLGFTIECVACFYSVTFEHGTNRKISIEEIVAKQMLAKQAERV